MLRYRTWWLVVISLLTAIQAWFAFQLPIVTTLRDLLPDVTPGMALYTKARRRFGGDETAYLALKASGSGSHFSPEGLEKLKTLTARLEGHPFVERVVSPSTAQELWVDSSDTLVVDRFVREGRNAEDVLQAMRAESPFEGTLVSEDGQFVLLVVSAVPSTDEGARRSRVWKEVERRAESFSRSMVGSPEDPHYHRRLLELAKQSLGTDIVQIAEDVGYVDSQIYAAGFTTLISLLLSEAEKNLTWVFPLALVIIFLMLLLLFRRLLDALLPFVCAGPAVIWAFALGGLAFGRVTIVVTIAPVIVLVVGVSDVVHLLTQYRRELARGLERDEAIYASFLHVGDACGLTSLTTLVGFGAMVWLPLPTARELGLTAGIGVVVAFVFSFILTPILLSYTHPKVGEAQKTESDILSRLLDKLVIWVVPRPRTVAALGIVVTAVVLGTLSQYKVENALTGKLYPHHPVRQAAHTVEQHFGAAHETEILIDAGSPGGLTRPEVVTGLAQLRHRIESRSVVDSTLSYLDLLERIHSLIAPDLAKEQPLPHENQALVAQYLLLFEISGGQDLNVLIDPTKQYARMVVRQRERTAEEAIEEAQIYESWAQELLPPGVNASANGIELLAAWLGPAMLSATLQGFLTALGLIALMVAVLFRSLRVGLLSVIPNLFPVALGLVAMPLLFEQIDIDTLTFIPVCVGIAVDDTIHFLSRLSLERQKGRTSEEAVATTIRETGHGILRTSIVLIGGFIWVLLSDFQPVASVGLLLPVTLVGAVIMDLTLLPAMAALGWLGTKP